VTRIAVVGAGAVGCYFGGMLARAGADVILIGRHPHVDAIARDGLFIDGVTVRERIPISASTDLSALRGSELVLFCVKTVDTETTARAIAPFLERKAVVMSLQNGVDNVARIEAALQIKAVATVVYVAVAMSGPGHVKHSGRGDLIIGGGPDGVDLPIIAGLFQKASVRCDISETIQTELWKKMVMNCAYNAVSALGRAQYGRILRHDLSRQVVKTTIEEVVAVARGEGVALPEAGMLDAAWKLAEAMAEAQSSTAQDIQRGKRTEIDSLNGYIVRRAAEHGIPAPVNSTLYALVKLLEEPYFLSSL
jgi:2-dehydropantoate 2-reductase